VFGRSKASQTPAAAAAQPLKAGGKGRPTPSRREAESRNKHPLIGRAPVRAGASKEERKEARAAQKVAMNEQRAKMREAMVTGEEKFLPARDQGPSRRYARDYVDARRNLGEYLLPAAFLVLILNLFRLPGLAYLPILLLYVVVLAVAVDSFLLRRKITRLTTEKFGAKAKGAGAYAMMRSLQMRRTRMPRPQVQRGEYPS